MKTNFYRIEKCSCLILAVSFLAGCAPGSKVTLPTYGQGHGLEETSAASVVLDSKTMDYEINPEDFTLSIQNEYSSVVASLPGEKRVVDHFVKEGEETRWEYPEDQIAVTVVPEKDYLSVTVTSMTKEDNEFRWPNISAESYYMPLGEGKRIPGNDENWRDYLGGQEFTVLEQFSMPFWAAAEGDTAVLYIMENPYRSDLVFSEDGPISFSLVHQYPAIDVEKENRFRIYLTENNPVSAAKIYREYVNEKGRFKTLEQKAAQNPNIKKLYGAPHIYLWGERLIAPEDIQWPEFRKAMDSPVMKRVMELSKTMEGGEEISRELAGIATQEYVGSYQKELVCRTLSDLMRRADFYDPQIFPQTDEQMLRLLERGAASLNESELMQLNKHALAANLPGVFQPVEDWMNSNTVDLMTDLKQAGIDQAWIGLNSWEQAYAKPELVETAEKQGYLISSYDSYHSIHKPGEEQWITAKFPDKTLYESAAVTKKNGEKESGFQGVGRKLNPTLAMTAVEQRMKEIMSGGFPFNSWFIDCDATGEIYDDYTPEHTTTQQEDLKARLDRMAMIRDKYQLVVGSEGGNDFAADTIAFAHGIELKSFSWMDEDMKSKKDSEYFIGAYYNPTGGVAEHFSKQIPVKDEYKTIFVDPRYDVPLFKLVYNDSVITSYHWDWSTFKIAGEVEDRMLREVLYNTPPLYHLDRTEWEKYKTPIADHTKVWSQFSQKAVLEEMTDFKYLKEDGSVQMTSYGEKLSAVANFSDEPFTYANTEIAAHSVLITEDGKSINYKPDNQ